MAQAGAGASLGYNTGWGGRSPIRMGNWYEQNCLSEETGLVDSLPVKTMILHMHGSELKTSYATSSSEYGRECRPAHRPKSLDLQESVLRAELAKTRFRQQGGDAAGCGANAGAGTSTELGTTGCSGGSGALGATRRANVMQPDVSRNPAEEFMTTNALFFGSGGGRARPSEVPSPEPDAALGTATPAAPRHDRNVAFSRPIEDDLDTLWKL